MSTVSRNALALLKRSLLQSTFQASFLKPFCKPRNIAGKLPSNIHRAAKAEVLRETAYARLYATESTIPPMVLSRSEGKK